MNALTFSNACRAFWGILLVVLLDFPLAAAQESNSFGELGGDPELVAPEAVAADAVNADSIEAQFKGSLSCSNCHVAPQTKNILDGVEDFVMLTEYQIWLNDDPHSRAWLSIIPDQAHFNAVRNRLKELNEAVNKAAGTLQQCDPREVVLPDWGESNKRSQQILQKMFGPEYPESIGRLFQEMTQVHQTGGKRLKEEQFAAFTPRLKKTLHQCLSCHAGWKKHDPLDFEIVKYGTGVSCEACHGPSEKWLAAHSEPEWRKKNPHEKQTEFAMVDVRHPLIRTEQCYSCHIGNVAEGKVVTHEMYAAGHPPLPGIEIESFADQIPRHWRYLSEKKPDFDFASEFKQFYGRDLDSGEAFGWTGDDEYPRTRNLLVGGVMASAHSVDLLAESAGEYTQLEQAAGGSDDAVSSKKNWPEFAAFDCAACHHDLKADGWDRGFAGVPGRPPAQYWPRPLAKLGLAYLSSTKQADHHDEFTQRQQAFQAALDRQPFGVPADLHKQGTAYASWLRSTVTSEIYGKKLTRTDAIEVLRLLCGAADNPNFDPKQEAWDFHSARQMAWAINLVYTELQQPRGQGERWLSHQAQPFNDEFGLTLQRMRESLMLELPPTGKITAQQHQFLTAWRDFDRSQFLAQIDALKNALSR